jgi:mannose-6-phosphate isomerase-like protein (cupin superfamily)
MRISGKVASVAGLFALCALPALAQQNVTVPVPAGKSPVWYAWAPKPKAALPPYGPNKPVTRLPEVLAAHKGQASWNADVVQTKRWSGKWIQMAPGEKTRPQFWGDDRTLWVVWSGQIRFNIEGQQPFVATKGFLVQVPYRVPYSLETVGNEPSLRFEVTHAGKLPSYPAAPGDQPPPNPPGYHYIKVSYNGSHDGYNDANRPYIDFMKDYVAASPNAPNASNNLPRLFANDDDTLSAIIRGMGVPTPPETNRGHFHIGNDEFWFILEGKIDYLIEDVGLITADPGDVVFVPPSRWHRASWHAGQMDTRLSFNSRPTMLHAYAENANGTQ